MQHNSHRLIQFESIRASVNVEYQILDIPTIQFGQKIRIFTQMLTNRNRAEAFKRVPMSHLWLTCYSSIRISIFQKL